MDHTIYPLCAYCKGPIHDVVVNALGQTYHEHHFLCAECANPIKGGTFKLHNKQPFCIEDYDKLFAKRCAACQGIIKDFVLTANGKSYHKNCFVCTNCKTSLNKGFYEKHDNPYCQDCAVSLFSNRCKFCNLPIQGLALNVMGGKFHPSCFRCHKCEEPIKGDTFKLENGQPVCVGCSS